MTDVMYLLCYITPQHCKFLISSLKLGVPVLLHRVPQRMANVAVLGTSKAVIWERAGADYLPPTRKCRVVVTRKRASELQSSRCSASRTVHVTAAYSGSVAKHASTVIIGVIIVNWQLLTLSPTPN